MMNKVKENLTMGSLFDGVGAFPLAGLRHGITPIWASEIEPFPILVTWKNIPQMKHLGNIKTLNGAEIPPCCVVTFGSPCQDISIGSNSRTGLAGSRSSLFFEAIRVIKEMRNATGNNPRFIVWENVLNALRCNSGEDFRTILEEIVRIKYDEYTVPKPEKWLDKGNIVGDDFSLAWCVLDSRRYVPQRRKRIFLVADFAGERAAEILSLADCLSRNSTQIGCEGENFASDFADNSRKSSGSDYLNGWENQSRRIVTANGVYPTLDTKRGGGTLLLSVENHGKDGRVKIIDDGTVQTLAANMGMGGNNVGLILEGEKRIFANNSFGGFKEGCYGTVCATGGSNGGGSETLVADKADNNAVYTMTTGSFCNFKKNEASTVCQRDYRSPQVVLAENCAIRRLTPLETCRLQNFPDDWCFGLETPNPTENDIDFWYEAFENYRLALDKKTKSKSRKSIASWLKKPHSDAAIYKAMGNSITVACAEFVLAGIAKFVESEGNNL